MGASRRLSCMLIPLLALTYQLVGQGHLAGAGAASLPRAGAWQTATTDPRTVVTGAGAVSGDRFFTRDGRRVTVLGLQAPLLRDDGTAVSRLGRAARKRLQTLVTDTKLRLNFDPADAKREGSDLAAHAYLPDGRLLSEVMISEGFAWPELVSAGHTNESQIVSACNRARKRKLGVHGGSKLKRPPTLAFHRGVGMGIYSRDPDFDYRPHLDALATVHATHLLLITPWFMKDWKATDIEAVAGRTAPFSTVARVARQARERGLRVVLMPIVLLETGTKDHWRGDIQPASRLAWWRNYARLMGRFADLAEGTGASLLSVGSEFSSLERYEDRWRTLIRSIRLRYQGPLTYSANWDHYWSVPFWDALDRAGMTGYHSLTKKNDPTFEEIVEVWTAVRKRLMRFQKQVDRPIFITELGYASVDGINKDPWNYFISRKVDLEEQADCFRAFIQTWKDAPSGYAGAYFYDWWRNRDKDDRKNYSIQGKPAEAVISEYYAGLEGLKGK